MSTFPPSDEKHRHHHVAVMQHTLHAVRTAGHAIEFCAECALSDKGAVQKLLLEWSEGRTIAADVAIAPEPVWWHLGNAAETRSLASDAEARRFAAGLPHAFRGALEIIGCNAADGMPVATAGEGRWLLGVTPGDALATAAAEAIERGIVTAALESATLGCIAASSAAVQLDGAGAVRLWVLGRKASYVFTIGGHGVEAVSRCAIGFDAIFAAAQHVFGLNSPADSARLLFNGDPANAAGGAHLAAAVAPQLDRVLRAAPSVAGPVTFACTGLTNREMWFARELAEAVGLPYWVPNLDRYCDHLGVNFVPTSEAVPSLNLLGTLHVAASHARGDTAWRPAWGSLARGLAAAGAAQEQHEGVHSSLPITLVALGATASVADSGAPHGAPVQSPPPAPSQPVLPAHIPQKAAAPAVAGPAQGNGNPVPNSIKSAPSKPASSDDPASPAAGTETVIVALPGELAAARVDAKGEANSKPQTTVRVEPASSGRPRLTSPPAAPAIPAANRSAPPPPKITAPSTARTSVQPRDESEPSTPAVAAERAAAGREPTVIVLRKRGYWPHAAIASLILGLAIAGKFYLDADAIKTAAAREKRAADNATENAEREVAAAVKQVRLASEQAARADQRARELAEAAAREEEKTRAQTEAARDEALKQARREVEEHTRQLLARQQKAVPVAPAPGTLTLASAPVGADVSVDGRPALRAPASIEGLSPGHHTVKVTLAGHVPVELGADIVGSKTTDLGVITLERATGSIDLSSEPNGLEFDIRAPHTPADAAPLRHGRTPARLDDLPTGDYVVTFRRGGWSERTERVTIAPGAPARVAATIKGGTVKINSSPSGATVLQGGLLLGTTPLTLVDVPPRDATYELSAPGFEPLKVNGKVVEGQELELDGILLDLDRLAGDAEVRTPPRPYLTTPLDLRRVPRSTPPRITVSFVVQRNGSVHDVKVLEAVDKNFAKRAAETIAKWKYYPAVSHAGYPVNVRMKLPITIDRGSLNPFHRTFE